MNVILYNMNQSYKKTETQVHWLLWFLKETILDCYTNFVNNSFSSNIIGLFTNV